MAKWLVTGGYGFIGSNIVQELLKQGEEVSVLDNLATGRKCNLARVKGQFKFHNISLLDAKSVADAVQGCDYVLHQAAIPSVQRSIDNPLASNDTNVTGTLTLLDACRKAGVKRVVYAASSSAYGNQPVSVKIETLLPIPLSPYAVSKLTGEYYMQSYATCFGLETVCLRYFNVFGPNQDPTSQYSAVIPLFITKCLRGESPVIYGDGTQSRDFTFVLNNVRANILAATTPGISGQVMNIACNGSVTLLELLDMINDILGTNVKPVFQPSRKGDVMHSLASIEKAKSLMGYSMTVDFKEGLRQTIDWYKDNQ